MKNSGDGTARGRAPWWRSISAGSGPSWPGAVSYTHLDVYKRQEDRSKKDAKQACFASFLRVDYAAKAFQPMVRGAGQRLSPGPGHGQTVQSAGTCDFKKGQEIRCFGNTHQNHIIPNWQMCSFAFFSKGTTLRNHFQKMKIFTFLKSASCIYYFLTV